MDDVRGPAIAAAASDTCKPDATRQIAAHVARLRYEDLPTELVQMLKQCVLDTIGVSIAASTLAPEAKSLHAYVQATGGVCSDASLWGFGGRAPAGLAVFLNASLGHMVDYDDVGAGGHLSIATIPVAIALAQQRKPVSGRALITALAAGFDVHTRLNQAIRLPDWTIAEGWFPTQLFGYLSGTSTAARLLGFDSGAVENAFGIAFNQMAGSRQMAVGAATHMRSMQAGFSGQASVLSVDLTTAGIVGSREVLEGRYGLFRTYIRTEPDWDAMLSGLGKEFPVMGVHGFKVWPACGYTRAPNASIHSLRARHGIKADDVRRVSIIGGTGGTRLLCEPLENKRRPKLAIDAKFSIPYTCAVMLARGTVTLSDYTDEALLDPRILAIADKFDYRDDPGSVLPVGGYSSLSRPTVEIEMADGRVFRERAAGMPGDPDNPVAQVDLNAKFRDCVRFSAQPISGANANRVIELIGDLENQDDVGSIVELLTRSAAQH